MRLPTLINVDLHYILQLVLVTSIAGEYKINCVTNDVRDRIDFIIYMHYTIKSIVIEIVMY